VGIGTTNPANKLHVEGASGGDLLYVYNTNTGNQADGIDIRINRSVPTSSNGFVIFRNSDDNIVGSVHGNNSGGVNFLTTSDERLKENIESTAYGLDDLMKLQVRDYNFKAAPGKSKTGFVAQELYKVYPQVVNPGSDDVHQDPWTVDYGNLTPLLTKSIQDLKVEIDEEVKPLLLESMKEQQSQIESLAQSTESLKYELELLKLQLK